MGFDAVVAIARGGLAPGLMASAALSIPLYALAYARAQRRVSWFTAQQPQPACKVLLVEDVAGRGTTLSDGVDFLRNLGHRVTVFTLAYDSESRIKPDYGIRMPDGFGAWFPWERESITDAFGATSNQPDAPEFEYSSWAIDLDGVLLPDLPEQQYVHALTDTLAQRDHLLPGKILPDIDLPNVTIITGRPEQDRTRTQAWLTLHGFNGVLVMRDEARYTSEQTAAHKADAILARRHTHFVESDPIQALEIANRTRVARIFWWDGAKSLAVYASEVSRLGKE